MRATQGSQICSDIIRSCWFCLLFFFRYACFLWSTKFLSHLVPNLLSDVVRIYLPLHSWQQHYPTRPNEDELASLDSSQLAGDLVVFDFFDLNDHHSPTRNPSLVSQIGARKIAQEQRHHHQHSIPLSKNSFSGCKIGMRFARFSSFHYAC